MIPVDIWKDQDEFNSRLRDIPWLGGEEKVAPFIKDRALDLMSECHELLSTTGWKTHRRGGRVRPNREHRLEELIDIFKLWLTIVQGCGFTAEELYQAYWRKSMVVRQRHSEEWLKTLDRPAVVVDIDNVICDYTNGFCEWIANRAPLFAKRARQIGRERLWFNRASDFGMSEAEWEGFKHEFRSMGHKRHLPPMPDAKWFLEELRSAGYLIILLTSRPIDRYPNIFTDTIYWLDDNGMVYDWVWWSADKKERLIDGGAQRWVKFAVDDDPRYVEQLTKLGILSYWLMSTQHPQQVGIATNPHIIPVRTLRDVQIPRLQGVEHVR